MDHSAPETRARPGDADGDERESLYERTLRELRASLLAGDHEPGAPFSEAETAERLDIAPARVGEALSRLVDEGLLIRARSGAYEVSSVTLRDVLDAIELRGLMEGAAARIAAERGASPDGIARCRAIVERIDVALTAHPKEDVFARYAALNAELHETLLDIAQSPVTAREARRIASLPFAAPSAFVEGQVPQPEAYRALFVAQDQHHTLIDAIEAREGARAESIAREHARQAGRNLDVIFAQENPKDSNALDITHIKRSTNRERAID